MDAQALLETLRHVGAVVTVDGSTLYVGPRSVLTDDLRAEIRACKHEMLAISFCVEHRIKATEQELRDLAREYFATEPLPPPAPPVYADELREVMPAKLQLL